MVTADDLLATAFPLVVTDEDGEIYYCEGHADPWRFTLAVASYRSEFNEADLDDWLRRECLAEFVAGVRHTWRRERFPGDELMPECAPEAEGAQPFTEATL